MKISFITERSLCQEKNGSPNHAGTPRVEGDPARIPEKVYSGYILRIAARVGKLL